MFYGDLQYLCLIVHLIMIGISFLTICIQKASSNVYEDPNGLFLKELQNFFEKSQFLDERPMVSPCYPMSCGAGLPPYFRSVHEKKLRRWVRRILHGLPVPNRESRLAEFGDR